MPNLNHPLESRISQQEPEDYGHPRGTLAVVGVFGVLFLLGWLLMYVYLFMQRGAPH
jgi:cytochrome c oxidase subunit IIa family protein